MMVKKTKRRPKDGAGQVATEMQPIVNEFTARQGTYRPSTVVDLGNELGGGRQKTYRVIRNLYPTVVDRWVADGGPGFDDPQRRAIDHCRALWQRLGGSGTLVANLNWIGGGNPGRERGIEQAEALAQLSQYESRIPRAYWRVFENVVRHDMAARQARTWRKTALSSRRMPRIASASSRA